MGHAMESYGPYGSKLTENYSFQLAEGERITEVSVTHGWMVDAFGFVIAKPDGSTYSVKFGGDGGNHSKIVLKDNEFLTRISGKHGYDTARNHEAIASLTIHTNICPEGYGPYGLALDVKIAYDFSSSIKSDCQIVGVFGRSNKQVESIGVLMRKRQDIEWYGPYGSQLLENFDMQLQDGELITQVIVRHGFIVDAIGFVIGKPSGVTTTKNFGGNGREESKIVLKDGECLAKISGKYGYDRDQKQVIIATLRLHTNLCPMGYGPYGLGKDVYNLRDFSSPLLNEGPIVGVFGRQNNCLESVGVIIKKEQLIESYGPYGSRLPKNFVVQLEDGGRISEIRLTHGWIMDSIGFVISTPGKGTSTVIYGGRGGEESEILLKDGEYLIRISGTYGYDRNRKQEEIASLKIHTNLCPAGYGPFGLGLDVETPYEFSSPHLTNGPIIGVFGRSNNHLESIGVLLKTGQVIESYGPYGSQLQQNYCMQARDGERISEVRIFHGYVVDAIGFVMVKRCGRSTSIVKSGGNGQEESKIVLKEGEYVTRISGTYGNYKNQRNEYLVATLKMHTNLCPLGYGPFGLGTDVDIVRDFSSPLLNDCPIVGVFGRSNSHVESIGVLLKKEFRSSIY